MVLATLVTAVVSGVHGALVRVEVDVSPGLPVCHIVGLPDAALSEARERVRTAIRSAGYTYPASRITVNLEGAPVDEAYRIPDEEMAQTLFELLEHEGLSLGGSSGINVAAAVRLAEVAARARLRGAWLDEINGALVALYDHLGEAAHANAALLTLLAQANAALSVSDAPAAFDASELAWPELIEDNVNALLSHRRAYLKRLGFALDG